MLYLLDADTLISADHTYYPLSRFPVFWQWLRHNGDLGKIKVPLELYDEVVAGKGALVDWLKAEENKNALLLTEEADPALVAKVTTAGYAADLDEAELLIVGHDPFLISYGLVAPDNRCVVSFEVSAPSKQRANRKVPDVCATFGVKCINLFRLIQGVRFYDQLEAASSRGIARIEQVTVPHFVPLDARLQWAARNCGHFSFGRFVRRTGASAQAPAVRPQCRD